MNIYYSKNYFRLYDVQLFVSNWNEQVIDFNYFRLTEFYLIYCALISESNYSSDLNYIYAESYLSIWSVFHFDWILIMILKNCCASWFFSNYYLPLKCKLRKKIKIMNIKIFTIIFIIILRKIFDAQIWLVKRPYVFISIIIESLEYVRKLYLLLNY